MTTASDPEGRPTVVGLVDHSGTRRPRRPPRRRHDRRDPAHERRRPRAPAGASEVRGRQGLRRRALAAADRRHPAQARRRSRSSTRTGSRPRRRRCAASRAPSIELTIHEGRNRQVKRMFEAVGHPVKRLHRSRYGSLDVEGLEPGAMARARALRNRRAAPAMKQQPAREPDRSGSVPASSKSRAWPPSIRSPPAASALSAARIVPASTFTLGGQVRDLRLDRVVLQLVASTGSPRSTRRACRAPNEPNGAFSCL